MKIYKSPELIVQIQKNSLVVGSRSNLNLIEGANISLNVSDNQNTERVDITVAVTGLGTMSLATETDYAKLAGRVGGQTLIGGIGASENLTLQSTSHATKGKILFGTSAYDEVNNRLGIGKNNPACALDILGSISSVYEGAANNLKLYAYSSLAPTTNSAILAYRARGTIESPSAVLSGDRLLAFGGSGYNGTGFLSGNSAVMNFYASENWSETNNGSYISFATTPNGSTYVYKVERLRIDQNGNVGIGVQSPSACFHLKAGTASAITAPLKFTSGVKLTIPEAGAMEYDGTNLYFTPSSVRLTTLFREQIDTETEFNSLLFSLAEITLNNITQITNRSHTNLSDIGTNTHPQIDTYIANFPFAQHHTQVSLTGTTDETELYSINIPGGTLGTNGLIRIWFQYSMTNNANTKTARIKLGGTQVYSLGNASILGQFGIFYLANRNAENSQIAKAAGAIGFGSGVIQTFAIDTSIDNTLQITGQLANVADTMALESITVEIIK